MKFIYILIIIITSKIAYAFEGIEKSVIPLSINNSSDKALNNKLQSSLKIAGKKLYADKIEYSTKDDIVSAYGNIIINYQEFSITADKLVYNIKSDTLELENNIIITTPDEQKIYSKYAVVNLGLKEAVVEDLSLYIGQNTFLYSKTAKREKDNVKLSNAKYSPCPLCFGNKRLWQITSSSTTLDNSKKEVYHKNATFEIFGVPVLYTPFFAHPSPDSPPKSGILFPRFEKGIKLPIYVMVSPNLDFTITPKVIPFKDEYNIEVRNRNNYGSGKFIGNMKGKQYYINAKGDYANKNNFFGYNLNNSSTSTFLIKENFVDEPYLLNKGYFHRIDDLDFFSVQALTFQKINGYKTPHYEPFIIPYVRYNKFIELPFNIFFLSENKFISSQEHSKDRKLNNIISENKLTHTFYTPYGQVVNINTSMLFDARSVKLGKYASKEDMFIYPRMNAEFRYPLISSFKGHNFLTEPVYNIALYKNLNKDLYFTPDTNEPSEFNFSRIYNLQITDKYTKKNKLFKKHMLGVNNTFLSNYGAVSFLIGKEIKSRGDDNIISNIMWNYYNHTIYATYKVLSKGSTRRKILLGYLNKGDSSTFKVNYIKDLKKSQVLLHSKFNLWKNFGFDLNSRISLDKLKTFSYGIGMTYKYDCAIIGISIKQISFKDTKRNIKNTTSYSIYFNLKTLST